MTDTADTTTSNTGNTIAACRTDYNRIREILRATKDCIEVTPMLNYETFTLSGIETSSVEGVEQVMSTLSPGESLLISRGADDTFVLRPTAALGDQEGGGATKSGKSKVPTRSRGVKRRPNMWNSYTTYKSREIRHNGGKPPQRWGSNPDIKAEYETWKQDPDKAQALVQMSQMSKLGKLPEHHVPLDQIGKFAESINLTQLMGECGMAMASGDDWSGGCAFDGSEEGSDDDSQSLSNQAGSGKDATSAC